MLSRSALSRRAYISVLPYRHAQCVVTNPSERELSSHCLAAQQRNRRTYTNIPSSKPGPSSLTTEGPSPPPPQTWLTTKVKENAFAKVVFFRLLRLMGYGSAKQYAGRRAFAMYSGLVVPRPDEESIFWKNECHLPPTFQSWFTVANLHVWLLTVRLRALPDPHGTNYIQGLIDHFFLDVEDRVRAVLQPTGPDSLAPSQNLLPYTSTTSFYDIANAPGALRARGRAPESLVTRQMKIFKEQWAGMGMSFDLGLVRSDAELAAAVWRNMLGARGARGVEYATGGNKEYRFRRTINLAGGEVEKYDKIERAGIEAEEARDDGSGLFDYPPSEVDKYVAYPELMASVVEYVRRELVRLESISDKDILGAGEFGTESEGIANMRFGSVRSTDGLVASFQS